MLPLPKELSLNLPTQTHPSWAVSNPVFQLYLMLMLPKGHDHPCVCHRGGFDVDCVPRPNYFQSILSPTITSNKIITQVKKNKPIPIQQLKNRFWRNSCLVRELQCTKLEKESRNVWIFWIPEVLGTILQKSNITGSTEAPSLSSKPQERLFCSTL